MEVQVRAILKTAGWTLAGDMMGLGLIVALLAGGTQTPIFAALLLAAPVMLAACMIWGTPDER
jgi:hypothetical protein